MYQYKIDRLVKITNSDTLTVDLDLGFKIHTRATFKLNGIEVPELDLTSEDDPEITIRRSVFRWFKWAPRPWTVQIQKQGNQYVGDVYDRDGNVLAQSLEKTTPSIPSSEAETQVIKFDGVPQAIIPNQD